MRKWLYAPAALAALVLADALLWWVAVGQLQAGLDHWAAQARASGWSVSAGPRTRRGFPFRAELAVAGVAIDGGARLLPGGMAWRADRLKLEVSILHPATLVLSTSGPQHLRLSHVVPLVFTAAGLRTSVPLIGVDGGTATLEASGVQGGIAGSRHPEDVQLASLRARFSGQTGSDGSVSARLDVQASGLGLPDTGRWPLSPNIAQLGGTLLLTSPPLGVRHDGADASADPQDQARAWRDGGGTLVGQGLTLRWGPLAVAAEARLGLDERLQPEGSGTADVAGAGAALDALAVGGVLPTGVAATAKVVLALMPAATGTSGPLAGQETLHLPFRLKQSTLTVARIPVVQLGEIAWRRAPLR